MNNTFGTAVKCAWTQPDKLQIVLGMGFTAHPGLKLHTMMLTNADSDIKNRYGMDGIEILMTIQLTMSGPPVPPSSVITGPSLVGLCNRFFLDSSQSLGNYGRPFVSIRWNYNTTANSQFVAVKSRALNANNSLQLSLDAQELSLGQHTFNVTVTNWLGNSSMTTWTIRKVGFAVPIVALPVPQVFSMRRASPLNIRSSVVPPPSCNSTTPSPFGTFIANGVWSQVFSGSSYLGLQGQLYAANLTHRQVSISTTDSLHLFIAKNSLKMGRAYGFNLRASTTDLLGTLLGEINVTFVVNVEEQPVVVSVSGGSIRDISVVEVDPSVSAENSPKVKFKPLAFDPANASALAPFAWEWHSFLPNTTNITLPSSSSHSTDSFAISTNGTLTLASKYLLSLNVSSFDIAVRATGQPSLSSTARSTTSSRQHVILRTFSTPDISIAVRQSTVANTIEYLLNPGDRVVMTSSVENYDSSSLEFSWSSSPCVEYVGNLFPHNPHTHPTST